MQKTIVLIAAPAFMLTACAKKQGQGQYNEADVGVVKTIEFGTVLSARQVDITGKNSGTGLLGGAAVGGAVAGTLIEQVLVDSKGMEYISRTDKGRTLSLVQNINEGDVVFQRGDRAMIQECEAGEYYKKCVAGGYQRLLPTDVPAPAKAKRAAHVPVVN